MRVSLCTACALQFVRSAAQQHMICLLEREPHCTSHYVYFYGMAVTICRIFKRQHLIRGLQHGLQPSQQPGYLVQLTQQLVQQQLCSISLLQVITAPLTSAAVCSSTYVHHIYSLCCIGMPCQQTQSAQ
jgi:hypothetical protein